MPNTFLAGRTLTEVLQCADFCLDRCDACTNLPPIAPPPPLRPPWDSRSGLNPDDVQIISAITTNVLFCAVVVLFFFVFHRLFRGLFYLNATKRGDVAAPLGTCCPACTAFIRALRMPDEDYVRAAGVDAMVFVELCRLLLRCLLTIALWTLVVDMSCYLGAASGLVRRDNRSDASDDAALPYGVVASSSLANVAPVDASRWYDAAQLLSYVFSLLGMWLTTAIAMRLLEQSWGRVVGWCQASLNGHYDHVEIDIAAHALIVRSIDFTRVTQDDAIDAWEAVFPGQVVSVRVVRDTASLPAQLATLQSKKRAVRRIEDAQRATAGSAEDPALAAKLARAHTAEEEAREKVLATRRRCVSDNEARERMVCASGLVYFVIFRTARACTIAKQVACLPADEFEVLPCPVLTAIDWRALRPPSMLLRRLTRGGGRALYWTVVFFWSAPISFVSSLNNLPALAAFSPLLSDLIERLGGVGMALLSLLPTIVLQLFNLVLPYLCRFTAARQGYASKGTTEAASFDDYFFFQYLWTFLGVTIANSLLDRIGEIVQSPTTALTQATTTLAHSSTFFMTYELLGLVTFLALYLTRVAYVCLTFLKRRVGLLHADEADDEPAEYQYYYGKVMFTYTLGVCLSAVSPLVSVVCTCSLGAAYAIYKKNILYCYTHPTEDRGAFFPTAAGYFVLVLITAQVILLCLHASKLSWFTFLCLLPLPHLTYRRYKRLAATRAPKMSHLPLATHLSVADPARATTHRARSYEWSQKDLSAALGTAFFQPELVHSDVSDAAQIASLIQGADAPTRVATRSARLSAIAESAESMRASPDPSTRASRVFNRVAHAPQENGGSPAFEVEVTTEGLEDTSAARLSTAQANHEIDVQLLREDDNGSEMSDALESEPAATIIAPPPAAVDEEAATIIARPQATPKPPPAAAADEELEAESPSQWMTIEERKRSLRRSSRIEP